MITARSVMAEVVRALAVLALVFLSFAPHAAVAGDGYRGDPASYDWCGSPPGNPLDHAPCHACRATPATLPPAPALAEPAFAALDADICAAAPTTLAVVPGRTPANPRAPPALV